MTRLFDRLVAANSSPWRAYTEHAFVRQLGDGTLPRAAFQRYLIQDYLFLIHFCRAYGLAIYKTTDLGEMRGFLATSTRSSTTRWRCTSKPRRVGPERARPRRDAGASGHVAIRASCSIAAWRATCSTSRSRSARAWSATA